MPDQFPSSLAVSTTPKPNRPLNTDIGEDWQREFGNGKLASEIKTPADIYHAKLKSEGEFALVTAAVVYLIVARSVSRRDGFLILGTLALIGCVLFPPFRFSFQATPGYTTFEGYGSLWDPPKKYVGTQKLGTHVNTPFLLTELLVITAATSAAYLLASRPKKTPPTPGRSTPPQNAEKTDSEKA